ncbi:MAG: hypothetical protein SX243_01360 [Acidobacteriota bacterium]|jgi:hypothetical protein|nr:hypothetical protein [Acidobacteriota bacterium]
MVRDTDIDKQASRLIKALQPTLRHHLGLEGLERQFVTELYWRLRQTLVDCGGLAARSNERPVDPQKLTLDVYLTAATCLEGSKVTPDLLSTLSKTIEQAIEEFSNTRERMTEEEDLS